MKMHGGCNVSVDELNVNISKQTGCDDLTCQFLN